jgi:hypothetical protein
MDLQTMSVIKVRGGGRQKVIEPISKKIIIESSVY